jgi:glycosyltransferase involved in cell wall biosynthesis
MACGAALITTDSGGPDDFIEAGQTALVVPPRQAQSLASAILQLLVDDKLRWSIANAGSSDASAMTWEANAAATEAILRQVVDAGGPA